MVAVLDIKGENFAVTRRYRQSLGRQVVVLNPFGVIEPSKDRFNPLDYIRQAHLVRDIEVIAEGLVRPEGGNGSHFAEMAKSMIAAVIEVVMTRRVEADRNLITVVPPAGSSTLHWHCSCLFSPCSLSMAMTRSAICSKLCVASARIVGPAPERQTPRNPSSVLGDIDSTISVRPGMSVWRYGW